MQDGFAVSARVFHWLVFLMVLGQYLIMQAIPEGPSAGAPEYAWLWFWHESMGATLFVVVVLRLLNRLRTGHPARPADMPAWQIGVSHLVHTAIYLVLLAMPILGWIKLNAFGETPYLFGFLPLPHIVGKDDAISKWSGDWHVALFYVLVGLLAVHILAALYHGLIRRDGVLSSMLPWPSR
jgi:cytochrome b561